MLAPTTFTTAVVVLLLARAWTVEVIGAWFRFLSVIMDIARFVSCHLQIWYASVFKSFCFQSNVNMGIICAMVNAKKVVRISPLLRENVLI